ncbi:MAG TPA: magnesium/cobalt transporter CorA [Candidatus Krumholzibacteria bacterium]|nr:magnesium/cobalt transporter CorA [Candidatus Krumholzibacteria bacterium]
MTRQRRKPLSLSPLPHLFRRTGAGKGAPPGTLVYDREKRTPEVSIRVMDYGPGACHIRKPVKIEDTYALRDSESVSWIDIEGLHDTDLLAKFGEHFGLHPLVLEDILNTHQRPKLEEYEDYFYIVARMLIAGKTPTDPVHSEQVSFILGKHFIATFQEIPGDVFDPVRHRVEQGRGRSRKSGADYLLYTLLDAIVDNYFVLLQSMADRIESVEQSVVWKPQRGDLDKIHKFRRELVYMRRNVWPLRDVVASLDRTDSDLIAEETRVYLRDLHDHVVQVIDAIENFRDVLMSLQDLYMSGISNRTNEIIRVLTIISTIFVPLTFLAGVYGMNFHYFPELAWKYSYLCFWIVSLVVVISLIAFLRRRNWL